MTDTTNSAQSDIDVLGDTKGTPQADAIAATPGAGEISMTTKWIQAIQPFVSRLGLSAEQVTQAILAAKLVKIAHDDAVEVLSDPDAITNEDFISAFPEATKGDLRKAVSEMRNAAKPATPSAPTPQVSAPQMLASAAPAMATFVIPDIPEGEGLLAALSSSKSLTVDAVTIRAALEAYQADQMDLSGVPERLADLMEHHADAIEEPVGEEFLEILKFVRARKYADVNVESRLVTGERKRVFMGRMQALPRALTQFHAVLSSWNEQLKSNRSANPLGILSGANFWPPPDEVIGASEIVVACLKKTFGGFGVQVARALAYESIKIRETLERPELPALTGSANRELMLTALGCRLTNADVRMERNVARYVLYVATEVPRNLPGGQEGPALEALYNLGQMILPWMSGQVKPVATSGSGQVESPFPMGSDNRRRGNRGDGSYRD